MNRIIRAVHDGSRLVVLAALVFSSISAGVVWFLRLNHYPLYRTVPMNGLADYIQAHNRRLLLPLIVPMAIAIGTTGYLLIFWPASMGVAAAIMLGLSVLAILVSTAALQRPAQLRLERSYNPKVIDSIVNINWIRTLCWSMNVVILVGSAAGFSA